MTAWSWYFVKRSHENYQYWFNQNWYPVSGLSLVTIRIDDNDRNGNHSLQMLARILLLVGFVSGQGRVPLHSLMTEEELRFYFGDRVKICPFLMMKQKSWCFCIIFDNYLSQLFDRVKICPLLMLKKMWMLLHYLWWLFVSTDGGWDPRELRPWDDQEGELRYKFCSLYRMVLYYIVNPIKKVLSVRIS